MLPSYSLLGLALAPLLYYLVTVIRFQARYRRFQRLHGCEKLRKFPQKDPFLGFDLFLGFEAAAREHRYLEYIAKWFSDFGSTFQTDLMGDRMVWTNEPSNIQAMLTTNFPDFELGDRRRRNSAELLGVGLFNADGKDWEHARQLLRPNFTRKQVADLAIFETHVRVLIDHLPGDGSKVDIQEWLFRLVSLHPPYLADSVQQF